MQCTLRWRVLVSTKVTKYLFPWCDVVGNGPHTSEDMCCPAWWSCVVGLCEDALSLASAHALQVMSGIGMLENWCRGGIELWRHVLRNVWVLGCPSVMWISCASDGWSSWVGSVRGLRMRLGRGARMVDGCRFESGEVGWRVKNLGVGS